MAADNPRTDLFFFSPFSFAGQFHQFAIPHTVLFYRKLKKRIGQIFCYELGIQVTVIAMPYKIESRNLPTRRIRRSSRYYRYIGRGTPNDI